MVNVFDLINKEKEKFHKLQQDRSYAHNTAQAEHLKREKEKRIQLEGKANLSEKRNIEQTKIHKAKETLRNNNPLFKALKSVGGELKKRKATRIRLGIPPQTGADRSVYDFGESPFKK